MKAIILEDIANIETNPLKISEVEIPKISENEVLIEIYTCGICHTDLHIVEGDIPLKKKPLILGHQIVGKVVQKGNNVMNFNIGDRVGVPWLNSTCGKCSYCLNNKENLCDNAKFTGYDVDGGYAEYNKINYNFTYKIPENFTDESAAPLLCAGIIGYRALKISDIKPNCRLGLYGFGASAHIAIQIARYWGCDVYVFSRSKKHRKLAEDLGAKWVGATNEKSPVKLDSAISFAPAGEIVPLALQNLDKGGTLALAGIYTTPIPQFEYNLIYQERCIRSVANSTRDDAIEFLKIAGLVPVKVEFETYDLKDANNALKLLKDGKINGAGVLVVK
ncbi:MAG: alcohol dehydrogenase [Ignavibacteriae bacterium]|nr:MAG: alcohol dehydrogenase [Ignavibacteriota bacterium]